MIIQYMLSNCSGRSVCDQQNKGRDHSLVFPFAFACFLEISQTTQLTKCVLKSAFEKISINHRSSSREPLYHISNL